MKSIEIDLELHRAIEAERRGFDEPEHVILKRLVGRNAGSAPTSAAETSSASSNGAAKTEAAIPIGQRKTGNWSVATPETRYIAKNIREAYITAIAHLAGEDEGLFGKLAGEGGARRNIVARSAKGLYPGSPHLAEPHRNNWHELDGWFVDLNISRDTAAKRIKLACTLAGKRYGRDLTLFDGLTAL